MPPCRNGSAVSLLGLGHFHNPRRVEVVFGHGDGGDALTVWEIRHGRGLKRRLALVTMQKFSRQAPRAAAQRAGLARNVLNVPGMLNITPEQARINPDIRT